jgi:hypothetical protein
VKSRGAQSRVPIQSFDYCLTAPRLAGRSDIERTSFGSSQGNRDMEVHAQPSRLDEVDPISLAVLGLLQGLVVEIDSQVP